MPPHAELRLSGDLVKGGLTGAREAGGRGQMPGWGLWISGHPAWQQAGAKDLVEGLPTRSSLEEPELGVGPQPLYPQACGS